MFLRNIMMMAMATSLLVAASTPKEVADLLCSAVNFRNANPYLGTLESYTSKPIQVGDYECTATHPYKGVVASKGALALPPKVEKFSTHAGGLSVTLRMPAQNNPTPGM